MCVKDSAGGLKGDVMVTPGTGQVRFEPLLRTLYDAGFSGPLVVECVGGDTAEKVTGEARKAREFLAGVVERL